MKQTLLIITALMLIVGCSADPIDGSTLIEKGGLMYAPYSGEAVWYYENGQKERERTYKDGEEIGSTRWEYYSNGQKKRENTYKDGLKDRKWTYWFDNGQKSEEKTYKDGKLDGLYTEWYSNGQKEEEGIYKDGEKYGKWTQWYHENGQKSDERTYKNGELIEETYWDEDGNVYLRQDQ